MSTWSYFPEPSFQVGVHQKTNFCEIYKADVRQQPLSLKALMVRGDERQMQKTKRVPVGS